MNQSSGRNRRSINTNEHNKNNKESQLNIKCNKVKKSFNEVGVSTRSKRNKDNKKKVDTYKTTEISLRVFNENKEDYIKKFFEFKNIEIENPINGNDINLITFLYAYKKDKNIESNQNIKCDENVKYQLEESKLKQSKNEKINSKENKYTIPSLLNKKRLNSNKIESYSYKFLESNDESILILRVIGNNTENKKSGGSNNKYDQINSKINNVSMAEIKKSFVKKNGKSKQEKIIKSKIPKKVQKTVQNNKISNVFKPKENKEEKITAKPILNVIIIKIR